MDAYASHQQLLVAAALQSPGPMVELGCGDYSTPLLAEIAAHQGRSFEVYTTDMSWGSKYRHLCKINHIESWDDYPYPNVGFTFLDNEQYVRDRKKLVPRLMETSVVVVCHDFGENVGKAKYSATLNGNPQSVVMSNTVDVKLHRIDIVNKPDYDNYIATVCCVYKTGGDYTAEYVQRLYDDICQHSTLPFRFFCFSDSDESLPGATIPLEDDLPGWWSKLELFRNHIGRVVYFDLDTIITGNIDPLLKYDGAMMMLEDFCHAGKAASGVMAWNGPVQMIYKKAMERVDHIRANPREGDQEFIFSVVDNAKWAIDTVQDLLPTYSYKVHCKDGVPDDSCIVCFHGRPRPHEVDWVI